jgi:pyrophosphatase PpaX
MQCIHLHQIEKFLDVIITFEDAKNAKPDPEPILNALEILNEKPSNTLMVGDSPADIRGAKNAGVLSAAVEWSVFPTNVLKNENPDYYISNIKDLLYIVDKDYSRNTIQT